jgi:hypothetical protein
MTMLVINGGYETYGIERLGITHTMDNDGPSSVKGRNFEYFSENPIISGIMAAEIIKDANSESLVTTIKHFVFNDRDLHRNGIFIWCDEQAMRGIHLKAFENPEITYDSSLIGTLDTLDDWTFEFPYIFTFIRFILNNITNVVIYAFRFIL